MEFDQKKGKVVITALKEIALDFLLDTTPEIFEAAKIQFREDLGSIKALYIRETGKLGIKDVE